MYFPVLTPRIVTIGFNKLSKFIFVNSKSAKKSKSGLKDRVKWGLKGCYFMPQVAEKAFGSPLVAKKAHRSCKSAISLTDWSRVTIFRVTLGWVSFRMSKGIISVVKVSSCPTVLRSRVQCSRKSKLVSGNKLLWRQFWRFWHRNVWIILL